MLWKCCLHNKYSDRRLVECPYDTFPRRYIRIGHGPRIKLRWCLVWFFTFARLSILGTTRWKEKSITPAPLNAKRLLRMCIPLANAQFSHRARPETIDNLSGARARSGRRSRNRAPATLAGIRHKTKALSSKWWVVHISPTFWTSQSKSSTIFSKSQASRTGKPLETNYWHQS
jgi:hypothetical protein